MGVVVFNYTSWIAYFPEFTTTPNIAVVAPLAFTEAEMFVNNTDASLVCSVPLRTMFLNLITAHIVALRFGVGGASPSALVGRVSSAAEGSVNVAASYDSSNSAAWFNQTNYGAEYWQASAQFRMMRYVPAPMLPYDAFPRW